MTLAALLGIDQPIVLGPFGGLSSVELTAAVSNLGGLGSYGCYGYGADRVRSTVAEIKAATPKPFAVNVWCPLPGDEAPPHEFDLEPAAKVVAPFFAELGLPTPAVPAAFLPSFDEQLDALLETAPPVVSFVFGAPGREFIDTAHASDMRIVATATTVAEAMCLQESGVDAIVATGFEAGGHRVSFLPTQRPPLIGTLALVPQVVDAVSVPVIAAGGIADRRGVAAAFALGANGVQVGTAFLRTRESAATRAHREAISSASAESTVLTRAMSGRIARGLENRAVRTIETSGAIAPFPAQNWLTGQFRAEAAKQDVGDLLSLWMGQSAALASGDTAAEVFDELVAGVRAG